MAGWGDCRLVADGGGRQTAEEYLERVHVGLLANRRAAFEAVQSSGLSSLAHKMSEGFLSDSAQQTIDNQADDERYFV